MTSLHDPESLLFVTGATGLVGSHVVERACQAGIKVRAMVRSNSQAEFLRKLPVELVEGSLDHPEAMTPALRNVTHVVHCAAKVGDWGPICAYRKTNVEGLRSLLNAVVGQGAVRQFIHISSLGVYEARDHYGSDETVPTNKKGIDGYTLTKVESEELVLEYVKTHDLPAVVLRPGFIYGPRDRTVLPKLLEGLKKKKVVYLGSGQQLLNLIYVENLVDAIFLALERPDLQGRVYNLTDGRLVTRIQFMETICNLTGFAKPKGHVPLPVARFLTRIMEGTYRLLGKREAPLLSQARIKFLGLHLDYCIDRAVQELHYQPRVPFDEGMSATIDWARQSGLVS